MNEYELGKLAGLSLTVVASALVGSLLVPMLLGGIAIGVLNLPVSEAILGGLLAVVLHWASTLAHHLGHAWSARRTGYPMTGIGFGTSGVLATSLHPPDEQTLPAKIHIQRALGGPVGSLLFLMVGMMIALLFWTVNETLGWAGIFFFLENLLIFTLGVFLPLGFTDGSTLLQWWGKR